MREALNAIFSALSTGRQWRAPPKDLPPKGLATQERGAFLFSALGAGRRVGTHSWRAPCRGARSFGTRCEPDGCGPRQPEREGRSKRGSALDPRGYDAGRKVTGRKRRILVDAQGLLIGVSVLAADIQDRDGVFELLRDARRRFPFIAKIFADAGYQGPKAARTVAATGNWKIETVIRRKRRLYCRSSPKKIVSTALFMLS